MKQITVHLLSAGLNGRGTVKERESLRRNVTSLTSQLGKIDRPDVDTGRGSRFHPGSRNSKIGQLVRNPVRRFLADASSFESMLADVHLAVQEGSGRQNKGTSVENCTGNCTNAGNFAILKEEIGRKIGVNT